MARPATTGRTAAAELDPFLQLAYQQGPPPTTKPIIPILLNGPPPGGPRAAAVLTLFPIKSNPYPADAGKRFEPEQSLLLPSSQLEASRARGQALAANVRAEMLRDYPSYRDTKNGEERYTATMLWEPIDGHEGPSRRPGAFVSQMTRPLLTWGPTVRTT